MRVQATGAVLALAGTTLADSLLTSSDTSDLQLNADLVLLSACSTATSDGKPAAVGLSGIAAAFSYAGARSLMVTHRDIPSGPALDITTNIAHQRVPDASWSAALRSSVLTMIDSPKAARYAHPISWAGHFIVGAQ